MHIENSELNWRIEESRAVLRDFFLQDFESQEYADLHHISEYIFPFDMLFWVWPGTYSLIQRTDFKWPHSLSTIAISRQPLDNCALNHKYKMTQHNTKHLFFVRIKIRTSGTTLKLPILRTGVVQLDNISNSRKTSKPTSSWYQRRVETNLNSIIKAANLQGIVGSIFRRSALATLDK